MGARLLVALQLVQRPRGLIPHLLSAQVWVTIPQPVPSNRHGSLTALLAALDGAESIAIVG